MTNNGDMAFPIAIAFGVDIHHQYINIFNHGMVKIISNSMQTCQDKSFSSQLSVSEQSLTNMTYGFYLTLD